MMYRIRHDRKSIALGTAVTAALACPAAVVAADDDHKVELYGVAEVRTAFRDDNDVDTFVDAARLGAKGSHPLSAIGLAGIGGRWQIEFDLPVNAGLATDDVDRGDVALRKALVHFYGGFGEVIYGRQNNQLAETKKMDQFKLDSGEFLRGPDRIGNTVTYITPTFLGGLQIVGQIATDGDVSNNAGGDQDEDVDATNVGVNYYNGPIALNFARYDTDQDDPNGELALNSFGASYSGSNWSVFGTYQNENETEYDTGGIGGSFNVDNWTLKAGVRYFEEDINNTEGTALHFLADYALSPYANAYITYVYYDDDAEDAGFESVIGVGAAISFEKTFM